MYKIFAKMLKNGILGEYVNMVPDTHKKDIFLDAIRNSENDLVDKLCDLSWLNYEPWEESMHRTVEDGDIVSLRILCNIGKKDNYESRENDLLLKAIMSGKIDVIQEILYYGFRYLDYGNIPLDDNISILLEGHEIKYHEKWFQHAVHQSNVIMTRNCLKNDPKFDPDIIKCSIEKGNIEILRLILEKYPNEIHQKNIVLYALKKGRTEMAKMLLERMTHLNNESYDGYNVASYAVEFDCTEVFKLLVHLGAPIICSRLLAFAVHNGNYEIVKILIDLGTPVRDYIEIAASKKNMNILALFIPFGFYDSLSYAIHNRITKNVEFLLKCGAKYKGVEYININKFGYKKISRIIVSYGYWDDDLVWEKYVRFLDERHLEYFRHENDEDIRVRRIIKNKIRRYNWPRDLSFVFEC